MLLRGADDDGARVLELLGPVREGEAAVLRDRLDAELAARPRGVVVDLSRASALTPAAVDVLNWATRTADGWPGPALAVCCAPDWLRELLLPAVRVHDDREAALRCLDERGGCVPVVEVDLDADETAPARARAAVRACSRDLGEHAEDLLLVVSELVTNAVRHGGGPVRLEVDAQEDSITVLVSDSSERRPAPREAPPEAEGGRGLLLVDLVAHETGVRPTPPGKAVWARLPR